MQEEPGQPGDEAAELQRAHLCHRRVSRHGGHRSLVEVLERFPCRRIGAAQLGLDQLGRVARALNGALRLARYALDTGHVADDEHVRVPGNGEIGQDLDPAGPVDLGAALVGDHFGQRAGRHPGRPHLGGALDAPRPAVAVLHVDPVAIDSGDHRAQLDLHAEFLQPRGRLAAELLAHRRQHRGSRVEQDHPGPGGVDAAEGALEGVVGEFGDLAGHLHAGRSGADDDEGQQFRPALRVAGTLGLLEGSQDASAQLQGVVDGLHTGRPLGEIVVAEVGLAGAGGDDQGVVRRPVGVTQQHRVDGPVLQVDMSHLTQQHLAVLVLAQDHPGERGDLALGDDPGRDLVEQWLEQVMGGLRDHLDVDVGPLELPGGVQAAET